MFAQPVTVHKIYLFRWFGMCKRKLSGMEGGRYPYYYYNIHEQRAQFRRKASFCSVRFGQKESSPPNIGRAKKRGIDTRFTYNFFLSCRVRTLAECCVAGMLFLIVAQMFFLSMCSSSASPFSGQLRLQVMSQSTCFTPMHTHTHAHTSICTLRVKIKSKLLRQLFNFALRVRMHSFPINPFASSVYC